MRTWIIALLLVMGMSAVAMAAGFPLVDGERQATIVFSHEAATAGPDEWSFGIQPKQPYTELATYIEKVSGRQLDTVCEDDFQPTPGKFPLYVGDCSLTREILGPELAKLDPDGYMIVIEPTRAFVVGPRRLATYWAVCQFLGDYLNVRWLMPGPLGEDIIKQDRIVVSPTKIVETPTFLSRQWSGVGYAPGGIEWSLRHRVHMANRYARYKFHHNLQNIFDPDKYYDQHPEYFPWRDGKRFRPKQAAHDWQPCMTEPGTVQIAAQAARDYFDEHPDKESFSFGTSDGAGWCHCPQCLALRDRKLECGGYPSPYSHLYYSWLSRVAQELAKTHPDKLLGCLAYTNTVCPPKGLELDRRILPYITFAIADTYAPRTQAAARQVVADWGALVDQIGFYDYAYGARFILPRIYPHLLQDTLQHGLKHNLVAVYAEAYPHWGLDAPRLYATTALWWDPDIDLDALLDEWNERMFREAAEPMKKYFARCEQALSENPRYVNCREGFFVFARDVLFDAYPPEVVAECTAYLDEAQRRARSDLVKQRLHFFRKTWDMGALFVRAYWGSSEVRSLIEQGAPLQEIAAAMKDLPVPRTPDEFWEEVKKRVGDDRLAYFPVRVLLGGKSTPANVNAEVLLLKARLVPEVLAQAAQRGLLNAAAVRRTIERQINEAFPPGGSSGYKMSVEHLRRMALPVVSVPRAVTPPQVNGILDDPVWSAARGISDFTIRGTMEPATYQTVIKLAYDAQNLYVALECFQDTSKLVVKATERDDVIKHDDGVEIFIRSAEHSETWAQFVLNPIGGLFDQWNDGNDAHVSHDFDCDWAAKVYPDRWTAELRAPLREMKICPGASRLLRINLVRNVMAKPRKISTWYPEPRRGGHADIANQGWAILE